MLKKKDEKIIKNSPKHENEELNNSENIYISEVFMKKGKVEKNVESKKKT